MRRGWFYPRPRVVFPEQSARYRLSLLDRLARRMRFRGARFAEAVGGRVRSEASEEESEHGRDPWGGTMWYSAGALALIHRHPASRERGQSRGLGRSRCLLRRWEFEEAAQRNGRIVCRGVSYYALSIFEESLFRRSTCVSDCGGVCVGADSGGCEYQAGSHA